mgnify:CR=1 FL=1
MRILIVVSTMTGTAEMLAENMADSAAAAQARVALAETLTVAELAESPFVVVVSSTYGNGEVPEPANPLYSDIEAAGELAGLRFGVVGIGDKSLYAPTFANGGRQWDQMLERAGATRLQEPIFIDVSGNEDMTELAERWLNRFVDCAQAVSA